MKYLHNIIFLLSFLISCTSSKLFLETEKIYTFKLRPQPIINSLELTPREFNFLEQFADTLRKDTLMLINVVSYREDGFYGMKILEHCRATELVKNELLKNGIEEHRITYRYGKADMDNNPANYYYVPKGVSSGNCILEIQLYYP